VTSLVNILPTRCPHKVSFCISCIGFAILTSVFYADG
jgi:hypothetical protein